VSVDRERARFGAWYELFPRSMASEPGRHGTFADVEARLPYVARMGFDVLYLPPIHPIGRAHRKGKNNSVTAEAGDVGSPWAIGGPEGGHTAIHPALGTADDFRRLVAAAKAHGLELALDLAFQCSPDHPWVKEHPEWFRRRPDGSIQYAENPPKKYQDIYPLDFDGPRWRELWAALLDVVLHWTAEGVRIFRVDNPHTKPFRFWEWLIGEARRRHPELVFLSEAFTRPRVTYQLAKAGFTQSYTYFTWRNTKWELEGYLGELTRSEVREFFRPSFWPNTPDILPEPLQHGDRAVFQARLVLAATLAASYGIYGPAYEQLEGRPLGPGREEYLDSEKYEVRHWDLERPGTLVDFIARLNRIRRENPALQSNEGLAFHPVDSPQLVAYSKATPDLDDLVLVVVNLDPHHVHAGWVELPLDPLGLGRSEPYQVHDLLGGGRYVWSGARNYVEVDPRVAPAQIFRIRRRLRTERDFDYFL
jgi:starch synthase (maltosyl-transferring)